MRLEPATLPHLWAHHIAKTAPLAAADYRLRVAEVLDGRVLAAVDATGLPVALGGFLVPDNGGPVTCWFSVVRDRGVERRMARLALLMRSVLRAAGPHLAGVGLAAYVDDGNPVGRRLAAALGFKADTLIGCGIRRWLIHGGHADRQDGEEAIRAGG